MHMHIFYIYIRYKKCVQILRTNKSRLKKKKKKDKNVIIKDKKYILMKLWKQKKYLVKDQMCERYTHESSFNQKSYLAKK